MPNILFQGCLHGNFDKSQNKIPKKYINNALIIISGDVQTLISNDDLNYIAVPDKYKSLGSFHKYYNKSATAMTTAMFIGGNHENSEILYQLPFGGWVAPNVFYMGRVNVIHYKNIIIGGLSGIYKNYNYNKCHFERCPLQISMIRSVYSVRKLDVDKLNYYDTKIDIICTHDWPSGIIQGIKNRQKLIKLKKYLEDDLMSNSLGNPYTLTAFQHLKPVIWASSHLHVDFSCVYHDNEHNVQFISTNKISKTNKNPVWNLELNEFNFIRSTALRPHNINSFPTQKHAVLSPNTTLTSNQLYNNDFFIDYEWIYILNCTSGKHEYIDIEIDTKRINKADLKYIDMANALELDINVQLLTNISYKDEIEELFNNNSVIDKKLLSNFLVPIPSWEILDYKNTNEQTKWWCQLCGIDFDIIKKCIYNE